MSKLEELIKELCPDGVEFVPLWSVTIWDKNFKGVKKEKKGPQTKKSNSRIVRFPSSSQNR